MRGVEKGLRETMGVVYQPDDGMGAGHDEVSGDGGETGDVPAGILWYPGTQGARHVHALHQADIARR